MRALYNKLFDAKTTLKQKAVILESLRKYESNFEYRDLIAPIVVELWHKKYIPKKEIYNYIHLADIPYLSTPIPAELYNFSRIDNLVLDVKTIPFYIQQNVDIFSCSNYVSLQACDLSIADWSQLHDFYGKKLYSFRKYSFDAPSLKSYIDYALNDSNFNWNIIPYHDLTTVYYGIMENDGYIQHMIDRLKKPSFGKKYNDFVRGFISIMNKTIPSPKTQTLDDILSTYQLKECFDIWDIDYFLRNEYNWHASLESYGTPEEFLAYLTSKNFESYVNEHLLPRLNIDKNFYNNLTAFRDKLSNMNIPYTYVMYKSEMKAFIERELQEPGYLKNIVDYINLLQVQHDLTGQAYKFKLQTLMEEFDNEPKKLNEQETTLHV